VGKGSEKKKSQTEKKAREKNSSSTHSALFPPFCSHPRSLGFFSFTPLSHLPQPKMATLDVFVAAALDRLSQMPDPASVTLRRLALDMSDKRVDFAMWNCRTRTASNMEKILGGIRAGLAAQGTHVGPWGGRLRSHMHTNTKNSV
jgi:hypothetical protein